MRARSPRRLPIQLACITCPACCCMLGGWPRRRCGAEATGACLPRAARCIPTATTSSLCSKFARVHAHSPPPPLSTAGRPPRRTARPPRRTAPPPRRTAPPAPPTALRARPTRPPARPIRECALLRRRHGAMHSQRGSSMPWRLQVRQGNTGRGETPGSGRRPLLQPRTTGAQRSTDAQGQGVCRVSGFKCSLRARLGLPVSRSARRSHPPAALPSLAPAGPRARRTAPPARPIRPPARRTRESCSQCRASLFACCCALDQWWQLLGCIMHDMQL